ncbi:hypothetical protein BaRGS_00019954 [Batillaria attramentaria]|uniref:Ammonium transporter AmtB-like domain-containing protein n=1 Tax=Batillaria attramentaria TaxID=370345 RepID=A0ABD0KNR1_9CAEN
MYLQLLTLVGDYPTFKSNMDQFFVLTMGIIVFLIQCGFAFLEVGAVRSKNTTNILIKNLLDCFVSGIAYWLFGYAFAYSDGNSFIGYKNYWALHDLPEDQLAVWFFQYTFAATAATIVSGAVAERCEFMAYFAYSFFITGFIYPVVTHWVWYPGGWLALGAEYDDGANGTFTVVYQDFAGSGALHVLGGVAAFCGAVMLGPRIGRFHPSTRKPVDIRGHSVPMAALGGFILVFGFLAFNGGSLLAIADGPNASTVSLSITNTVLSASTSAFTSLLLNRTGYFGTRKWSILLTINGALGGMELWEHWWRTPDEGIFYAWDRKSGLMLAWQVAGVLTIIVWTAVLSLLLFGLLRLFKVLRVAPELESKGLDIPKHGEPAYPLEAYGHGHVERILKILESGQSQIFEQGFMNEGFSVEQDDKGLYESPEVRSANGIPQAKSEAVTTGEEQKSANRVPKTSGEEQSSRL